MSVSRRTILKAGLSAGAAAVVHPWDHLAFAQQVRTRFSATSPQGKAMLVKYRQAVGLMKDPARYPRSDARSWNFQWYTHWIPGPQSPWSAVMAAKTKMLDQVYAGKPPTDPGRQLAAAMWNTCQAHGTNPTDPNFFQEFYFCVWHRWYVYQFEDIIRGVLNDQAFTLPYWDYLSGNVADLSIPPEFRDPSSPLYQPNRNVWVNNGERIDKQNPGSMNLRALNEPIYIDVPNGSRGFCPMLDGNPHGLVHVYVGNSGNMGSVPTAANDPVFWLHHSNIDRLWESWNRGTGHTNPAWPNRAFAFADAQGRAVSRYPAGANRTAMLQYQYSTYAQPPASLTTAATVESLQLSAQRPKVTRAFAASPVTLGEGRVRVNLQAASVEPSANTTEALFATPGDTRLYFVAGDISAPAGTASTYNVYLNLPESADATPAHPSYLGTIQFFGAAGHDDHGPSSHRLAFHVTDKVRALMGDKLLTGTPAITLVRHGEPEGGKPTIGQMLLTEG